MLAQLSPASVATQTVLFEGENDHSVRVEVAQGDGHCSCFDTCEIENVIDDRQDVRRREPYTFQCETALIG